MASMTIRNISESVHRALRARARRHGRSTEAEVRQILEAAVQPGGGPRFGDELAALGRSVGGVELAVRRSRKPMRVASFQ